MDAGSLDAMTQSPIFDPVTGFGGKNHNPEPIAASNLMKEKGMGHL